MGSVTHVAIQLVLFALCSINVISYGQVYVTPWGNAGLAKMFVGSSAPGQSGTFTQDHISGMDLISGTMVASVDKIARSSKSSKRVKRFINMAVATAMAEIVLAESKGSENTELTD